MSSSIRARSSDHALEVRLEDWLDRTELEPPGELQVDVTVGAVDAPPAEPPTFEQPETRIYRARETGGLTIHWLRAPAVARLEQGSGRAVVTLSPEAAADFDRCCQFYFPTVLIMLLRRVGWHHVHAVSARDPGGRGWLFAGDARAGKSTTAALLASRGWAVGNDDMVFLRREDAGVVAVARRAPIALRSGGRALLGRIGGRFDEARDKTLYTPEELGGSWVREVRPDILAFITVGDAETTMEHIGPRDVLSELVRWSAWVVSEPDLAQEHLDLLSELGRQALTLRGRLGRDLFEHPDRLEELVP